MYQDCGIWLPGSGALSAKSAEIDFDFELFESDSKPRYVKPFENSDVKATAAEPVVNTAPITASSEPILPQTSLSDLLSYDFKDSLDPGLDYYALGLDPVEMLDTSSLETNTTLVEELFGTTDILDFSFGVLDPDATLATLVEEPVKSKSDKELETAILPDSVSKWALEDFTRNLMEFENDKDIAKFNDRQMKDVEFHHAITSAELAQILTSQTGDGNLGEQPSLAVFMCDQTSIPLQEKVSTEDNIQRSPKKRMVGSKAQVDSKQKFDYDHLKFTTEIIDDTLHNVACNPYPEEIKNSLSQLTSGWKGVTKPSCEITRVKYSRPNFLAEIDPHWHNGNQVCYSFNDNFSHKKPYEPEYFRYILDHTNGLAINSTRHGLCAYCEVPHFHHLKTSAYGQHLALFHGIHSDNYLTPNPILPGVYKLAKVDKNNKKRRRAAHTHPKPGVFCPACFECIEVDCTKTTAQTRSLTKYLRHFKSDHVQNNKASQRFKITEYRKLKSEADMF